MYPTYGMGHATVAGACVTMLKAFFDTNALLPFCDRLNAEYLLGNDKFYSLLFAIPVFYLVPYYLG